MGTEWQWADVWDKIAEVRGDATALVHGDLHRSWRDFSSRSDALARSLVQGGAQQASRIAQYLYNSPEYLEVSYATYKAGLTPVNTNYRYRAEELAYLWSNADALAVVFHGSFTDTIESIRDQVPTVRRWFWVDDESQPCPEWAEPYEKVVSGADNGTPYKAPWGRSGDDIVMIYTGGTTGMPKGVMWRHHDMYQAFNSVGDPEYADLDHVAQRLSTRDSGPVGLPASPLMHATGYMFAKSMLTQGGTVVTLANRTFDPAGLLDVVEREKVEAMAMVGDAFGQPILNALDAEPNRWDLSSLTLLVSAGVMWSAQTKEGLATHLPTTLLVDLLGSTEAHNLGSAVSGASGATTAQFKLGPNAMVVTEDKLMAKPGESGLLAVGGPMPLGYFKDEEKTAKTFWTVEGRRVSVPGDWARLEMDGSITLLGRGSLCINTGGEKVFPEEVEEALETHPAVRDTTVVGIPNPRFGESIAAEVELNDGASVTTQELIEHVKTQIASYKAPRHLSIVASVGRLPNGKADYSGVRKRMIESLDSLTNT